MFIRTIALAAGLTGAVGLSQFPEFTQQYTQRLGGAVDELARQIAEFDADAQGLGLDRELALGQLATGGDFGAARAESMTRTIDRHDRLAADLAALEGRSAYERMTQAARFTDPEIAERTWQAYRPALPATPEGLVFAGVGFGIGWIGVALVLSLLMLPFRRRDHAPRRQATIPVGTGKPKAQSRTEPPLRRERQAAPSGPVLRAVRNGAPRSRR
ncbi:hypothetical protein GCM10011415_21790 [Salipiger pallidus]|uniref:DUF2937 family protein n=1 Tax=Salipiger pallidus TaxID=1775170 RepID=A0A8J3EGH2_9RHOB|nr:DUF2937 family protein [Salipiger pallidus]GGG73181.1 hypothetical protein GCM10011415_21790 [Salipiger pallidus]